MKIRNGFVSNSSSSSFVLITTKENYDKCFKTMNVAQQEVCEYRKSGTEKKFGVEIVYFEGISGNYSDLEEFFFSPVAETFVENSAGPEDCWEIWEEVERMMKYDIQNCFYSEQDF